MKKIAEDIIILHVYQKPQLCEVQFQRYSVSHRNFCHFEPFFALLPPNNLENQNFEKMKKASGYVIISHMCTKSENHMMCTS